jgi:hypothetical protein
MTYTRSNAPKTDEKAGNFDEAAICVCEIEIDAVQASVRQVVPIQLPGQLPQMAFDVFQPHAVGARRIGSDSPAWASR